MHTRTPRWLIQGLCLTSVLLSAICGGTIHAAAEPMVVVVRDVTPLGCTLRYSTLVGTVFVPSRSMPCPAGTVMSTVHVPLSEAIARHEAYVKLPSPHS